MRPVVVLSDAAGDLELGRDFYDSQDFGIGSYFVDSLLADIESLSLFHGIHPIHFGLHRMLATKFPFGIYYEDLLEETHVYAVLDLRRDPLWIHAELLDR